MRFTFKLGKRISDYATEKISKLRVTDYNDTVSII